jgi:hypothetical protein
MEANVSTNLIEAIHNSHVKQMEAAKGLLKRSGVQATQEAAAMVFQLLAAGVTEAQIEACVEYTIKVIKDAFKVRKDQISPLTVALLLSAVARDHMDAKQQQDERTDWDALAKLLDADAIRAAHPDATAADVDAVTADVLKAVETTTRFRPSQGEAAMADLRGRVEAALSVRPAPAPPTLSLVPPVEEAAADPAPVEEPVEEPAPTVEEAAADAPKPPKATRKK